jgi:methionyl aminopeptidase
MSVIIKTKEEIETLREGGHRLATILATVAKKVAPGVLTSELDMFARELIEKAGDSAAFLGYKPEGHRVPYPAALCVSVNSEVVHGIPTKSKILKEGDIVSLDLGLKHGGLYTDHCVTVPVGKITKADEKLLRMTQEALMVGIAEARGGARVGDVGYAIEQFVKPYRYGIVRELAGHGVGRAIHEDPYVPNYGKKGTGEILRPGMVIAIEPMLNQGSAEVHIASDGYTFRTADGKKSAHFEHTILITDGKAEILTVV